ncbi:MAG: hypothetical protein ACXABI_13540 [Candidatus Hodarchaeales archaeon]
MTAHTRRNKRNRTEIDIATQYFEEEKERTKQILKKKQQKKGTKLKDEKSRITPSSKPTQLEKKKIPTKRIDRKNPKHHNRNKKESISYSKQKNIRKRTVLKKGRNVKRKIIKRSKAQYFNRFKV